jgi:hypothetical protein
MFKNSERNKTWKIAAVQIRLKGVNMIILSIYRAPTVNFDYF